MGDIVVIGGGFAGLEVARVLGRKRAILQGRRVLVVDSKPTFDFLPVLPDVASGRVRPQSAAMDLGTFLDHQGVNYTRGDVVRVDPKVKEVYLKDGSILGYEFLVIGCGSVTNFFGMEDVRRQSLKLDSVVDAKRLFETLSADSRRKILIVGGGYTGVEIASQLAVMLRRRKAQKVSVGIVEKGEDILGALPEWMRDYCRMNLSRLKVTVYAECSLAEVVGPKVRLSNGMIFEEALVIWAAGVRTPEFVDGLPFEKDRQGRLKVDSALRCDAAIFAVGDAAAFSCKGATLRMGVHFSLAQADAAARNILRLVKGASLRDYRPCDIGYIVPMANRAACGKILFFRARGLTAWLFHYAMCVYRSWTLKTRLGLAADIVRR